MHPHPLLLALALTGALDAAAPAAASAGTEDLEAEAPRVAHRGWRHALGVGPHSTTFFSERGSQYTFHSGSLGYLGSLGARGVFLHAFALVPLQARQDGGVYSTANYYRRRAGGDLLLGWHWRWSVRSELEAEAGPGLHGTLIYLPGEVGYRDFSALPLGLGAGGILRWATGVRRFSRSVTVGAYASAAFDFYDPAHADDLTHGLTFRAGVALGLGARR
jgi:hypothetical protein